MEKFDSCRSCGSVSVKQISADEKGNRQLQCQDCLVFWKEIKYPTLDDDSEPTPVLKDGSSIIFEKRG